MGTPLSDVVSSVCAKSPKATVTRYDDVLLSRCHSLTVWPSSSSRLVITPVGDARPRRRHPQREVVEGLVGRLVVDGEPGVGAERLLHRPRGAVVGDGEAGGAEVGAGGRRLDRLGGPGVVDRQLVLVARDEVAADDQVLARVLELGVLAVDLDGRHLELRHRGRAARGRRRRWSGTSAPPRRSACGPPGPRRRRGRSGARRPTGRRRRGRRCPRAGSPDRGLEVGVDDAAAAGSDAVVRGRPDAVSSVGAAVDESSPLQAVRPASRAVAASAAAQRRACHSVPLSIGRTSLRPWWICALTVPSGAPTCWAISS